MYIFKPIDVWDAADRLWMVFILELQLRGTAVSAGQGAAGPSGDAWQAVLHHQLPAPGLGRSCPARSCAGNGQALKPCEPHHGRHGKLCSGSGWNSKRNEHGRCSREAAGFVTFFPSSFFFHRLLCFGFFFCGFPGIAKVRQHRAPQYVAWHSCVGYACSNIGARARTS